MKKWLWASFILFVCLCVAYTTYRLNTSVSEFAPIERTLKGAEVISVRVVNDSSDSKSFFPRPEVLKVLIIKEDYSVLYDKLDNFAVEWFWILQMNNDTEIGASGRWPALNDGEIYPPGRGFVEIRPGKATSKTKFGETPQDNDARYTTIYMSWVKNDIVSNVLSSIKR